ncbi:acyl-CoA thioesterase [Rossellomorea vietnamensis]|uniref:Acyl-CoA thioesterase n=2 Tax=Rossellomorea vietnamensis TaxID=218284 RepID=A0A5D4P115_9BACI|nr:thioesterase family protein [Rossellomorea vietnamensis]TYS19671.1 acyl-CoA thioesterase [Rossellomorea vietnamensis]
MMRITYIEEMEQWKGQFEFYNKIKVRFSETDMFGHLNNTVPFTYFEEARIEFFKSKGFMQDWVKPENETIPVVADLQCDFLRQVYFGQTIRVYVNANKIGSSSVDLHYMGMDERDRVCFTGRGTMVQISKETGKGVPWTDDMKAKLSNNHHLSKSC